MNVFAFPGQGSQFVGMGKDLFEKYPDFVNEADEILGYSIKELCLKDSGKKLNNTEYSQPAIFVVNALSFLEEKSKNKTAKYHIGHSIGEYNALYASGVFDFKVGLELVKKRGELMNKVQNGGMAAVIGLRYEEINKLINSNSLEIDVANINSPSQIVLSGSLDDIKKAEQVMISAGASRYVELNVSGAFHSRFMKDAADEFSTFIQKYSFKKFNVPVISNVSAKPYESSTEVKSALIKQIESPVRWFESIQCIINSDKTFNFIELGPGKVLTKLQEEVQNKSDEKIYFNDRNDIKYSAKTLVEVLKWRAEHQKDSVIYNYVEFKNNDEIIEKKVSFKKFYDDSLKIASLLQSINAQNEKVILLFQPSLEYINAFFGCLYAKAVAVPTYPPLSKRLIPLITTIAEDSGAKYILTNSSVFDKIKLPEDSPLKDLEWIEIDKIELTNDYQSCEIEENDIAFLQYTSGSTSSPKGVMVSQGNLLQNSKIINKRFGLGPESYMVSWLPPYHDMGLIGSMLQPLYAGFPCSLMTPFDFFQKPFRWLKMISHYKATISGAPNFAYDLCVDKVSAEQKLGLDLSSWICAYNGSEPVYHLTLDRFVENFKICGFDFKSFFPCYGLAEGTLFVAGNYNPEYIAVDKTELANNKVLKFDEFDNTGKTQRLVSCGEVYECPQIAIVNSDTNEECTGEEIGEIWIKSASNTHGYWNKEEITNQIFDAYTKAGKGSFIRTGDLGFTLDDKLYVTGRLKELIIIRGKNFYPQDIEKVVCQSHSGIRTNRVAAFSVSENEIEKLVITAEFKPIPDQNYDEVFQSISLNVSEHFQLKAEYICLIMPASLMVTTSGKIKRKAMRQAFLANELRVLKQWNRSENALQLNESVSTNGAIELSLESDEKGIVEWLIQRVASKLKIDSSEIDIKTPLGAYGLESVDAMSLSGEIEAAMEIDFPPTAIYENPSISDLCKLILEKTKNIKSDSIVDLYEKHHSIEVEDVAVIGFDGIYPQSDSKEELWNNLINSVDCISEVPEDRWNWKDYASNKENTSIRWGGFSNDMNNFDADFFGISISESKSIDPQHRKMLELVWRAIEDAGYKPTALSGKEVGVFLGASGSEFVNRKTDEIEEIDAYTVIGMANSMLSNRISYIFNFNGPSEIIDTACSSSAMAIHRAVVSLQQGECEMAIAGGCNALLSPKNFVALNKAGFLSKDGRCKTFDKEANGYVRAEGAGALLLKPLSKAVKDKDPIYAVIKGSYANHGGKATSLTAPNSEQQAKLIINTYLKHNISPDSISYLETHGTGTYLGDPIEINALIKGFEFLYKEKNLKFDGTKTCSIGSIKSNIGHLEAAAGVAGVSKILLALKNNTIPANINFSEQNPYIDIKNSPFQIVDRKKSWVKEENKNRRAALSSFGFGGSYSHLILEEYSNNSTLADDDSEMIFIFSAKKHISLVNNLSQIKKYIHSTNKICLKNVEYTLLTGREEFDTRLAIVASNKEELIDRLNKFINNDYNQSEDKIFYNKINDSIDFDAKILDKWFKENEYPKIAEAWVKGFKINWSIIYTNKDRSKVHLPGYCFEKQNFELPSDSTFAKKEMSLYDPALFTEQTTVQNIEDLLKKTISSLTKIPSDEINSEESFYNYGLTSIDIINIHSKINAFTNSELPPTAVYDYPTIRALSKYVVEGSASIIDLTKEVELDESIQVNEPFSIETYSIKNILLTGATGYFGGYLLKELLDRTNANVYCIVRAADLDDATGRIYDNLLNYDLLKEEYKPRIRAVIGDISKELIGLGEEVFEELSDKIDTIYHCAAEVDWMKPYMVLKKSNVSGTQEIIRLACNKRVKPLHFISSLAVIPLRSQNNDWDEKLIQSPKGITVGYGQSKWVAEHICEEAKKRGLPVSIYRFDFAVGSIKTGKMKETDFMVRMIKGCIQLCTIPEEEMYFNLISADYLSMMISLISLDSSNLGEIYHTLNNKPFSASFFGMLIKQFGFKTSKLPLELWKKLIYIDKSNALHALYPFIKHYCLKEFAHYRMWKVKRANTINALDKIDPEIYKSIPTPHASMRSVMRYLLKDNVVGRAFNNKTLDSDLYYWRTNGSSIESEGNNILVDSDVSIQAKPMNLSTEAIENLKIICQKEEISLYDAFVSIISTIYSRYNVQSDCIVTGLCNGDASGLNIMNMQVDLSGNPEFRSVASYVKHAFKEIKKDKKLLIPYEKLRNEFNNNDEPLYQVMLVFKDGKENVSEQNIGINYTNSVSNLTFLIVQNSGNSYEGIIQYNSIMYQESIIDKIIEHFNSIVEDLSKSLKLTIFQLQKRVE